MKESDIFSEKKRDNTKSFHRKRASLKLKAIKTLAHEKDTVKTLNFNKATMKSDNKLINFSELIPHLLDQIKTKNSSTHNLLTDNFNNSFGHDSNSSEINDDKESESEGNIKTNNNNSPIKIPKLVFGSKDDPNEYKNLEAPITYRQKSKNEANPDVNYRKYSKDNDKDSLVLKLHKYFFQDGELENIDTLIKYNINKIKINDNNLNINSNNNIHIIENEEFDYLNIKPQVISLMSKFAEAFDKENKKLLISAIKDLNKFSDMYKFDYVTQLTLGWLDKIKEKEYEYCELKYIGYYNQIRDIMDKMLNELKRKADMILITRKKNNKENKNENKNNNNNDNSIKKDILNNDSTIKIPNIIINRNLQKKNSINKDDLLRTKEIIPIKVDIEIQSSLKIDEVEDILKNLDEGDLGNLGNNKGPMNNNKKILNLHSNNRSDNELEAFSYPFKDDSLCYIF